MQKALLKCNTGPDPQIKAWVSHCACVVETGLATQHWSGKSEGCMLLLGEIDCMPPPRKDLKVDAMRLNLRVFSKI